MTAYEDSAIGEARASPNVWAIPGARSHTGRSRNDQCWSPPAEAGKQLARVAVLSREIARSRWTAAEQGLPIPATHIQRAVVSSAACGGRGGRKPSSTTRSAIDTLTLVDANPRHRGRLWRQPLDREHTTARSASLLRHAGLAGLRAARARQVRTRRAGRWAARRWTCGAWPGTCRCTPAPSSASSLAGWYTTGSSSRAEQAQLT